MQKQKPRALASASGAGDCVSQRERNPSLNNGVNKAPAGAESRRLNPATARYSPALPQTALAAAFLEALARKAGAA